MPEKEKSSRRKVSKRDGPNIAPFDLGKIPPQAVDFEEAVLGAVLLGDADIDKISRLLKPEYFYKDAHQKIFQAILELKEKKEPIEILSVTHQLKKNGYLDDVGGPFYVTQLTSRIGSGVNSEYHAMVMIEKAILREVIHVCAMATKLAFEDNVDIFELLNELKSEVERIEAITKMSNVKARNAIEKAVKEIEDIAEGRKLPYLKTGMPEFDKAYSLNTNQIVVYAAQKGHLKTRTLVKIVRGLVRNNEDMAFLWYSMEEPAEKMSRLAICEATGIDDARMLGKKKPKLSERERQDIAACSEEMWNDDIEYKEEGTTITSMKNNFVSFCKKRPDKKCVLIVDNFGRTKSGLKFSNSNEEDDWISNQYVDIRDETHGLIIIVHHLTKEQLGKYNLDSGYRPREENVRGSSRIIDYCNTLILGNFIAKHKDLLQLEMDKKIEKIEYEHEPFPMCYTEALLKINSTMDKDHQNHSFTQFQNALNNTLNYNFSQAEMNKKFPDLSYYEAVDLCIKRYHSYVTHMQMINKNRQVQFRAKYDDPLTYVFKEKYMHPLVVDKDSREYYLYGGRVPEILPHIKQLLILDGAKVRDGAPDDDIVLVRFKVNPGTMQYEQI